MYSHGERNGALATYLVEANERSSFSLWTNTTVNRVIRSGSLITGVEVEAYGPDGHCGVVNVTASTGRVILSAGTFGTPKILFRSGIGPTDMLEVISASSDGANLISKSNWIELPVGQSLNDHVNVMSLLQSDFSYQKMTDPASTDRHYHPTSECDVLRLLWRLRRSHFERSNRVS